MAKKPRSTRTAEVHRYVHDGADVTDFPTLGRTLRPGDVIEVTDEVEHPALRKLEPGQEPSSPLRRGRATGKPRRGIAVPLGQEVEMSSGPDEEPSTPTTEEQS